MNKQQKGSIAPLNVFISYAKQDKELCDQLKKHLSPLQREGFITPWHDGEITPGTDWRYEIGQHLSTASLILLLISPDFIYSDYCYSDEMQKAMERHRTGNARVIPLLLRPVGWERTPIGKLRPLPQDARPITTWPNQDEAFKEIERGVHDAVIALRTQLQLEYDQRISTVSQQIEADIPQPSATLESKMLQVLSDVQSSPLTAYERKIIHLIIRVIPPRLLRMLLSLWSELGEDSLHEDIFLAWRHLSHTERTGLLHVVEEVLKPLLQLSSEDRRDGLDALVWTVIRSFLKETIQSYVEDFLRKWEGTSEQDRSQSVNELIESWSDEGYAEGTLAESVQELIQEIRDDDSSVEVVEDTLREWKNAFLSANSQTLPYGYQQQPPPYGQPESAYGQQPYGQPESAYGQQPPPYGTQNPPREKS